MKQAFAEFVALMGLALLIAGCGGDDAEEDGDDEDNNDESSSWDEWKGGCQDDADGDIPANTTWQWQLTGTIDTSVDVSVYDIDLCDVPAETIAALEDDGRLVICYFSAGTWESWRGDAGEFPEAAIGNTMEEWEDEKWLDVRDEGVRAIMEARLDLAVDKGCDGVEPDNMDGYLKDNHSGFDFDGLDQLDYNQFIAEEAHARGLSVGLKNDVDQLEALEPCYDWALNEECFAYDECDKYAPFVDAGKAVFHVEYVDDTADGQSLADDVCGDPAIDGFSTLIKEWDLSEWGIPCP